MKRADGESCEIHTDSEFWIKVMTEWAPKWAENDWKKKNGPIKNLDIVQKLYELYNPNTVNLVWEKGHAGIEYNEMADEWANKAREGAKL
jgi:ribonuclease HI